MKMKTLIVLAFAIGCGLVAMMGVQQMIAQNGDQQPDQQVKVLVASIDISPGVLLNEKNCEFKELPMKGVPSDAVLTKEDYHDRGLLVPIMAGDIIRKTKLGERGEIAASASIPNGMRTISFQVNDTKTHSGLLQPGDRVDLQVTYETRAMDGSKQTKTAILLEYIEVFAADSFRNLEAGESKEIKAKNITVLATREQANFIQLANTKGELVPVMRSKTDSDLLYKEGLNEIVLEELRTGMNFDEMQAMKNKQNVVQQPERSNVADAFRNFLNQKQIEPVEVVEETKPKNNWTVTIYSGEDVITQEVSLPEEKTAAQETSVSEPSALKQTLKGFLKSFLPEPAPIQPKQQAPFSAPQQPKMTPPATTFEPAVTDEQVEEMSDEQEAELEAMYKKEFEEELKARFPDQYRNLAL